MARKSKLTKEVQKKVCDAIQLGATYELASSYAGINVRTFYYWMQLGTEGKDKKYVQFFQSVKEAESKGAIQNLAIIKKASMEDWRASAWLLTNRHGYNKENEVHVPIIQINTNQTDVSDLLLQVQENNKKLLEVKPIPEIDLDEE